MSLKFVRCAQNQFQKKITLCYNGVLFKITEFYNDQRRVITQVMQEGQIYMKPKIIEKIHTKIKNPKINCYVSFIISNEAS